MTVGVDTSTAVDQPVRMMDRFAKLEHVVSTIPDISIAGKQAATSAGAVTATGTGTGPTALTCRTAIQVHMVPAAYGASATRCTRASAVGPAELGQAAHAIPAPAPNAARAVSEKRAKKT